MTISYKLRPVRVKEGFVDAGDMAGPITGGGHQAGQGKAAVTAVIPQAGMGAQAFSRAPERLPVDPARRKVSLGR